MKFEDILPFMKQGHIVFRREWQTEEYNSCVWIDPLDKRIVKFFKDISPSPMPHGRNYYSDIHEISLSYEDIMANDWERSGQVLTSIKKFEFNDGIEQNLLEKPNDPFELYHRS